MKRLFSRSAILILCLCGLAIIAYYGDIYWTRYWLFRDNFAMSFLSVHRFRGDEVNWLDYLAWISFVSDGVPMLRHPEYYREVPCTVNSLPNNNPFYDNSHWLPERMKTKRLARYTKYRQNEEVLPDFECKQGHTEAWSTPYGDRSYQTWLFYRRSDGQVLFCVGHLY